MNISAAKNEVQYVNETRSIITKLIHEFRMAITEEKNICLLSTMKERFFELASEHGVHLSPNTFKTHLANAWDEVSFIPQEGISDLVYSADISARKKTYKLHQGLQVLHQGLQVLHQGLQVLH